MRFTIHFSGASGPLGYSFVEGEADSPNEALALAVGKGEVKHYWTPCAWSPDWTAMSGGTMGSSKAMLADARATGRLIERVNGAYVCRGWEAQTDTPSERAPVPGPRRPAPEIPPPVWDTRPIDPRRAWDAVVAMCKG